MDATAEPVFERSYRYEGGACDIHVVKHVTSQGEEVFRAAAYVRDAATGELRLVTDDEGVPYEVLHSTPSTAAERLAERLQLRLGKRVSGPEAGPAPETPTQ